MDIDLPRAGGMVGFAAPPLRSPQRKRKNEEPHGRQIEEDDEMDVENLSPVRNPSKRPNTAPVPPPSFRAPANRPFFAHNFPTAPAQSPMPPAPAPSPSKPPSPSTALVPHHHAYHRYQQPGNRHHFLWDAMPPQVREALARPAPPGQEPASDEPMQMQVEMQRWGWDEEGEGMNEMCVSAPPSFRAQ